MSHHDFSDANLSADRISCLGISCQRNTFITWDRNTLKPFHNFITWKDMRSEDLVQSWNKSLLIKVLMLLSLKSYLHEVINLL